MRYYGDFSRSNGISTVTTLQFVESCRSTTGNGYRGGMGKAEIKLYKGMYAGEKQRMDHASNFEPVSGSMTARDGKKKPEWLN